MYSFGVEKLEELNQKLIMPSRRLRSSGCEISTLSHLETALDLFYIDGRGFLLGEHVLRGCDIEIPFHPAVCDLLAILNNCPVQVIANGWRLLLGFIAKCRRDGVVATDRLFFYFFYPGRPQILGHAISNLK